MSTTNKTRLGVDELAAKIYHHSLPAWPGENTFYRKIAQETKSLGPVLEVACGTGRVAIDLAQDGMQVTGFDLSNAMLEIARAKSASMDNVRWEIADMRSFKMGERYGLILIPGHSFQFMLTPSDQMSCLTSIKRHLVPGGRLVLHIDHQDLGWLWDLYKVNGGKFEKVREVPHPDNGHPVIVSQAWKFEPSTQTASVKTVWEELDAHGNPIQRWERGPIDLHCIFRFEMDHLLARAGFVIQALYGSFECTPLQNDSSEMIWISNV
jgi:SAM-dependent methyltransferase